MESNLIGSLLLLIIEFTGGIDISEKPNIITLSYAELHQLCYIQCTAAYVSNTIYLPNDLDLTDESNHAILFHELVHFYQDVTKRWINKDLCQQYNDREREAYALQNIWYSHKNIAKSVRPYFKNCDK
jgi:hypothetical protein